MNLTAQQKNLLSELYVYRNTRDFTSILMKTNRTVQSLGERGLIFVHDKSTKHAPDYVIIKLAHVTATYIDNSNALWCVEARKAVADTATDTATDTVSAMLDILASRERETVSQHTKDHYHKFFDNDTYRYFRNLVRVGVHGINTTDSQKMSLINEIMVCFQDDTLSIIQGDYEANEAPSWLALEKFVYGLSNGVDILVFYNCDWLSLFLDTPPKPFANPMPPKVVPVSHAFKAHPKRVRPSAAMALEVVKEFEGLKVPPREPLGLELHNALEEALLVYTQILNPYLYERLRLALIKMLGYALYELHSTRTNATTYQDKLGDMLYKLGLDHKLDLKPQGLKI